ncbi:MAG TPA: hypothetical protein VLU25_07370 [Acidobacteriota bacterium]|nr:hypothetical protein [Acidobacteriota bacterium]
MTVSLSARQEQEAEGHSEDLSEVIGRVRQEAGPYYLRVDCTDERGARNLEVFPSGVAIWDQRVQLPLEDSERVELLGILLERGFAELKPLYGGKKESGEGEGPLRISCQVELSVEERRKVSRQLADGEQSARLVPLAGVLLDRIAPLAQKRGVTADDLSDGLSKLSEGVLGLEALRLLFVDLPEEGSQPGQIMQVEKGKAWVRPYYPGRELGQESPLPLGDAQVSRLAKVLDRAMVSSMPVNLWAKGQIEVQVRILDHDKTLLARPFGRLTPQGLGELQQRFDRLVEDLRELRSRWSSLPVEK